MIRINVRIKIAENTTPACKYLKNKVLFSKQN